MCNVYNTILGYILCGKNIPDGSAIVCVLTLLLDHQEKQDKVVLLAEMANLRENNQRLQEESQTASEQLRKFSVLFTNVKTGSDHEACAVTHSSSQRE